MCRLDVEHLPRAMDLLFRGQQLGDALVRRLLQGSRATPLSSGSPAMRDAHPGALTPVVGAAHDDVDRNPALHLC